MSIKFLNIPRIAIAATHSGSGKTIITLGIMAALKKRSLTVQGFKCGPDYIDPGFHTAITRRQSRNLDSWFIKPALLKKVFFNNAHDADISVIEGVMGLFDGRNSFNNHGSTAEICQTIQAPVILVLDARSMARSAAAIVRGFQVFSKKVNIAGVIANKIGSKNHLEIIRESVEKECGIPLIGGILFDEKMKIPERHLGLLPALESGNLDNLFNHLAEVMENSLDMDQLLKITGYRKKTNPVAATLQPYLKPVQKLPIKIAVARDAAFNFYYPENLEAMRQAGMEPVYFSPLKNEPLPVGVCGIYLGGGFPEVFSRQLSRNHISKKTLKDAIDNGMPAIAECGGFMYLVDEIVDQNNKVFSMTGILPGRVIMQKQRAALGYREISGLKNNPVLKEGDVIRGHEFHYSVYEPAACAGNTNKKTGYVYENKKGQMFSAYRMKGRNTDQESGFVYKNLVAGYAHFYFLSNLKMLLRWAAVCREYEYRKNKTGYIADASGV